MIGKKTLRFVRPRDLGFGSIVGADKTQRLLNRDGSFNVGRSGLGWRARISAYYRLITMRWPTFLGLVVVALLGLNTIFALLYYAGGPEAIEGGEPGFRRAFFFSLHTLTTIGFGHLAPATLWADLVVLGEAITGVMGVAIVTGLVFARFSRPQADFVFSHEAVVAPYRGGRGLMVRVANRRQNQVIELEAKVFAALLQPDGTRRVRSFDRLVLERTNIPFFPLSWTLVHPIDDKSPLYGLTADDLEQRGFELMVLMHGVDETFFQMVHARTSYKAQEVKWDARFGNMYERHPSGIPRHVDIGRIHDTEPVES